MAYMLGIYHVISKRASQQNPVLHLIHSCDISVRTWLPYASLYKANGMTFFTGIFLLLLPRSGTNGLKSSGRRLFHRR